MIITPNGGYKRASVWGKRRSPHALTQQIFHFPHSSDHSFGSLFATWFVRSFMLPSRSLGYDVTLRELRDCCAQFIS